VIKPVQLAGGSILLTETIPSSGTVSVGFWFPLGSRFEKKEERGFTHFVEHMVFKGTYTRSAQDIAREIDRLGGYLNAFTERDTTCFFCTLPAIHIETALDVLCDMIFSSKFDEIEFERERTVIASEILSARDDPEDLSNDEFLKAIWPRSNMARKIAGEVEEVIGIQRNALYEYYKKEFTQDRLIISVAGNIVEEKTLSLLEDKIAFYTKDGIHHTELKVRTDKTPEFKIITKERRARSSQVQLYVGTGIKSPFNSRDYHALSLINCAFGESMSSRLFQELREKKGLCYTVYSWVALAKDTGLFTIYGQMAEEQLKDYFISLEYEIKKLFSFGFSNTEIEEAKTHLDGVSIVASEDVESRMRRLAREYLFNSCVTTLSESRNELLSITMAEVDSMLARIKEEKAFSVFLFGPKTDFANKIEPVRL